MDMAEAFFEKLRPAGPEDMDSLLQLADLTRELAAEDRAAELCGFIRCAVEKQYYEALSWVLAILQEAFGRPEGAPEDFSCELGRALPGFSELTERLGVDFRVLKNEAEAVRDGSGEVRSFFNIFTYRTAYDNIYLVSSENFDLRDNDFIRYSLLFTRSVL